MQLPWLGRFLCWLGLHEFRVVSRSFEFRTDASVETVECRRCSMRMTRKGRSGFYVSALSYRRFPKPQSKAYFPSATKYSGTRQKAP